MQKKPANTNNKSQQEPIQEKPKPPQSNNKPSNTQPSSRGKKASRAGSENPWPPAAKKPPKSSHWELSHDAWSVGG